MKTIVIKCKEHGEIVIVFENQYMPSSQVGCPMCWHNDKIEVVSAT